MNFYNINDSCNIYKDQIVNIYYKNMSQTGFVSNLTYFDENCKCSINNEDYIGAYNVLVRLAENQIHRFNYTNFIGTCQIVPQGILISVVGRCQIITFSNIAVREIIFNETFLICTNKHKIINYICKYLF